MPDLSDFKSLYASYLSEAATVERDAGSLSGLWGVGIKAADHPCHEHFARSINALVDSFIQSHPSSSQVRDVLWYMFDAPQENRDFLASFWMLNAVQRLALNLIPLLNQEDAHDLWVHYANLYPNRDRLSIQEKVFDALEQQSLS